MAAMHGDIFYPTFLLRMILPVDVAMTWGMVLHFFLCGLATYWFLRQGVRTGFMAALIGGVAYMMGGFVSSLLSAGHDGKLFVSALLPVVLLATTWSVRDGKRWAWGALALSVGLAVLTPHPQLLQYLLLCTGAWALFLAFGGDAPLPRPVGVQRLALALASVLAGAAIGAIQFLPVRAYVGWSPRGPGFDYGSATQFSFPGEELINTYLPQFSGMLDAYWGRNQFHFHSEYVGAVVLVLAAAAFTRTWTAARRRQLWFWSGTGLIALLWALGESTPFFRLVYELVPGTKFFRAPSTIFYITTFAIAVLAALGTERLMAGTLSVRFGYRTLAVLGVVTLIALAGGFSSMGASLASTFRPDDAAFTANRIDLAMANASAVRVGALRSLLFAGLACALIILVALRRVAPRMAGWALTAAVAIDLWSIERKYWEFSPPAAVLYQTDPVIDFLRKVGQPTRVLAVDAGPLPVNPYDPFLRRDALMTHRIRTTLGYHGNSLGRYDQLRSAKQDNDQIANPTFWALTNTEFLMMNADSIPIAGATRVAGPVRNAAGSMVSLFLLPGEHPFAWVAPVIAKFPDDAVADALHSANFPVHSVALYDTASTVPGVQLTAAPAPLALTVRATHYDAGRFGVVLSAPAPKGSALVVSENFYPGWHATVDGTPVTVERADLALLSVPLPEGAEQVEFQFADANYAMGKWVTLGALTLAFAALVLGAVLERRTRSARPGHA